MPERTRSDELAALTTIAAQVNCTQDLDEILRGALETTLSVIGEDTGEIFLVDEDAGDLVLYVHQGLSDAFVADEAVVHSDECLCGLALRTGRPMRVDDMAGHPARSRSACMREGFSSCVRLPLNARGEVLGLLNIQSRRARQFTAEDEDLLVAIGDQIGIAIANAQLIDDAEQGRATLDSVMSSMVDGLILIDRKGRIAYTNACAEEMLGLPIESLTGRSVDSVLQQISGRAAEPEHLVGGFQGASANLLQVPIVEFALTEPEPRAFQGRLFPIHGAGENSLGLGLLLRDITREKELDEMKSQLLATVSHELRTPLASIKGFATTLLRSDVEWDESSRHEFLSIIDQESDRLSELIGNLLDMSRIEAGTLRVEPELCDLQGIIQACAGEFQVMTRQHNFQLDLPAQLPVVWADPRRARQVLRNLLENAVKYSPQGGRILVSAEQRGAEVQVSVSDQGLGIEPEYVDRLFERFYQVDSASTRQVGGSGLGLSISKAIVQAQNGRIWVESQPGVGSTFFFTLPLESTPG